MTSTKHAEDTLEEVKDETKEPPMYSVILLNDDFTPFDFVMFVMMDVFGKQPEEAMLITRQIHEQGQGVCGVYVKDIAESKQGKVMRMARQEEHPLQCVVKPESPSPKGPKM